MTRLLLVLAFVLLAVPTAQAKEISEVVVCGSGDCSTVSGPPESIAAGGDGIHEPAPRPQPYFEVTLVARHEDDSTAWTVFYVPGAAMLSFRGESGLLVWERIDGDPLAAFQRVTRGLEARPADAEGPWSPSELRAVPTGGDGGFPAALVGGLLAGAAAALALVALLLRRTRARAPVRAAEAPQ